jgi:thiamine pyrophosphate-dependent acetolactate synthase large subunit-like protein
MRMAMAAGARASAQGGAVAATTGPAAGNVATVLRRAAPALAPFVQLRGFAAAAQPALQTDMFCFQVCSQGMGWAAPGAAPRAAGADDRASPGKVGRPD